MRTTGYIDQSNMPQAPYWHNLRARTTHTRTFSRLPPPSRAPPAMRRQGDGISRAFPKGPKQRSAQGSAGLASLFSKLGVIDDLSMQRVEVTTTHALETTDPNAPD